MHCVIESIHIGLMSQRNTMASLGKIFPKTLKECIFSGILKFFILVALKDIKKPKKLKKANEGLKGHFEGQRA